MTINKVSAPGVNLLPPLAIGLSPGEVYVLPPGQAFIGTFGGVNTLPAYLAPTGFQLTGQYMLNVGPFTVVQMFDPVLSVWRNLWEPGQSGFPLSADGTNFRLANLTGTVIGAAITNAGSGLTNGFNTVTVTPSAGGSTWNTIVGGAINTSVTITAGGTLYTKPPILVFNPPANQGSNPYILPTAICTISAGAINAVTVTNQGAGLVAAPTIQVINQFGDTTGSGGVLTVNATLAATGTLLWMSPTYNGTNLTSLPTFTFSPASTIAATALMNWTVTGVTIAGAGVAYTSGSDYVIISSGGGPAAAVTAANTNPYWDFNLTKPRNVSIYGTLSGTTLTAGTFVIDDNGYGFLGVPKLAVVSAGAAVQTTTATVTATVGGQNDVSVLQSI